MLIQFITDTVFDQKLEIAYQKYGEQDIVLNYVTDEQYQQIRELKEIDRIGSVWHFGKVEEFNGRKGSSSIGAIDQEAFELGRISILSGRLPTNEKEIAVQSFLTEGEGKLAVNDAMTVLINGKKQHVKIVGVINNYSQAWTQPYKIQVGENDYPMILISQAYGESLSPISPTRSLWVKTNYPLYSNPSQTEKSHFVYDILNIQIGSLQENILDNNNLMNKSDGLQLYKSYKIMSIYFSIVLCIGAGLCCLQIFQLFYRNFHRKIGILRSYGATKWTIYLIVWLQMVIAFICSLIVSVPIIFILTRVLRIQLSSNVFSLGTFQLLFIWLVIMFAFIALSAGLTVRKLCNQSIATNLRHSVESRLFFSLYKKIQRLPFTLRYFLIHIFSSWKSMLLIILALSCSVFVLFFSYLIAGETKEEVKNVRYILTASPSNSYYSIDGFNIDTKQNEYLPFHINNQFVGLPYIQQINTSVYGQGLTLLLKEEEMSDGWKNWVDKYREKNTPKKDLENQVREILPKDKQAISLLRVAVWDDSVSEVAQQQYGISNEKIQEFKTSPSVFVFLNPLFQVESEKDLQMNQAELSRIVLKGQNMQGYILQTWPVQVQQIFDRPFQIKTEKLKFNSSSTLYVAVHESQAEKMNLFKGYASIDIIMEENVPEQQLQLVEDMAYKEIVQITEGELYSSGQFSKAANEISAQTTLFGNIIFVIVLFFGVLIIGLGMYTRLLQRRAEMALNHANGMRIWRMMLQFFFDLIFYVSCSAILSGLIIWKAVGISLLIEGDSYVTIYWTSLVLIMVASILSLLIPYIYLKKTPLLQTLRLEE